MKKSLMYMSLAVLVIMLTSCMNGNLYKSDKNGFSMNYPAGFKEKKGVMGTEVMFFAPYQSKEDKYNENISAFAEIDIFKVPRTLEQYFESVITVQSKKLVDGYADEKIEKTTLGGEAAYKLTYTIQISELKLNLSRYVAKHNGKFYVITSSIESSQVNNYSKQIAETLNSFKFDK